MKIEEKINESIKDSMKKKDNIRLDSLRAIKSAILIEKTKSGSKDQIEESVTEDLKTENQIEESVTEEDATETVSSGGNDHGIPEHLLERSKAARERLGA